MPPFPLTCVYTVITSAVLPTTPAAALQLQGCQILFVDECDEVISTGFVVKPPQLVIAACEGTTSQRVCPRQAEL